MGAAVTPGLGFGGAVIGGLHQWVDEETALAAVNAAWSLGVRFFDTAPHYGLGLSERRLGAALAGRPRSEYVLCTKVGRVLVPSPESAGRRDESFDVPADHRRVWDFSAAGVRRSLESSVDRLGVDRVDIVLLHDPDDHWEQAIGEAYPALHELRDQGVVGAIGAGMNQWQMLQRFVAETDLDTVMLAGRYTLLEQTALDSMLPMCVRRGVSVLAAGVFNSGLLAVDRPGPGATYDYTTAPPELRERALRIGEVCAAHGVSVPQAAMAFAAAHPAVAQVVVGIRTAEQMRANAELFRRPVPPGLWPDLVAAGLLRADAPVP
ncbi:MAG TPA: aldo/keto reductase [Actinophytocola sp.]|uniref:aldo/keto reductase n=1 Tax=Actinophytocola sp. TaxID=1872138 RepID=UPI002DB60323|nr:aldo/keto reductase [Actinophytocola sp.]HEU5474895.1 aldo/keto reductase [Actinophytocola sp.]